MSPLIHHRRRLRSGLTAYTSRVQTWARDADRGDVPGWVLITVMTAGLVAALWLVAEPLLAQLFTNAVSGVGGP